MNEIKVLDRFMEVSTDVREVKRALAVKMAKQGHSLADIGETLNVSASFVSKWKKKLNEGSIENLKIGFQGSQGYLKASQREEIKTWLRAKEYWDLAELQKQLAEKYGVKYKSNQSYYDLFHAAGISWKKKPEK